MRKGHIFSILNETSKPYSFKSFKGCLPRNLLSPLLNTLSQMIPLYKNAISLTSFYYNNYHFFPSVLGNIALGLSSSTWFKLLRSVRRLRGILPVQIEISYTVVFIVRYV